MGILDEVNNMKNQGMDEDEIVGKLQERGISPKSIAEAFNQMKIKKAVSAESAGEEGMEPSIMKNGSQYGANPKQLHVPKTKEIERESEEFYAPQPNEERELEAPVYGETYAQGEYSSPEEDVGQGGGTNYDTDTLIEIAEQVFSEKIKKEQKQISALNEFATLAETKISNDHERIKRIEEIIDRLQTAILEKIGSYGRNLDSIKNEMGMMQDSFGKMVPSLQERNEKSFKEEREKEKSYEEPTAEEPQEETTTTSVTRKKVSKKK